MTPEFGPIRFSPILQHRIWGGRRLETKLGKVLPDGENYGESWELSAVAGNVSRIVSGPFGGQNLDDILANQANAILGKKTPEHWAKSFPLLIKFLDARDDLSVQVHPKPPAKDEKHEAWYVVDATSDAKVYIGLKDGVSLQDLAAAEGTDRFAELLISRPARPGDCFNLPSGTVHALGAGLLVAEVQTTSDTTYRLYDWGRVDAATGRSRELHVQQALSNIRTDVRETEIIQPKTSTPSGPLEKVRVCDSGQFTIDEIVVEDGEHELPIYSDVFTIWMVVEGSGTLTSNGESQPIRIGDTLLIPAKCNALKLNSSHQITVLETRPTVG